MLSCQPTELGSVMCGQVLPYLHPQPSTALQIFHQGAIKIEVSFSVGVVMQPELSDGQKTIPGGAPPLLHHGSELGL